MPSKNLSYHQPFYWERNGDWFVFEKRTKFTVIGLSAVDKEVNVVAKESSVNRIRR